MASGQLKIFSGSAHRALTEEIAEFLGVSVGHARLQRFPDTEVSFQIDENIRGTDVFVVQPTCADVDRHLVEMCVMIDAFRRSSASRITAVIPYYGYARQDRKDKPRVPISAKLVANLITAAGANRVLTMDLHKAQIQGFFDIPVDHLFAAPVIIQYLGTLDSPNLTIVSPDGRNDREGRQRAQGERRRARVRLRGARRAVGSGDRAARGRADRPGDHHQHDPAHDRAGEVLPQDQAAVGRPAARPGDPQHSRGRVGFETVCLSRKLGAGS